MYIYIYICKLTSRPQLSNDSVIKRGAPYKLSVIGASCKQCAGIYSVQSSME